MTLFHAIKERWALRRWQKSQLGKALQQHGYDFFWSEDAPFGYLGEQAKLKNCAELHAAAMSILASENPMLAGRERLGDYVHTFADLMVSGMRPDGKSGHELYSDSPYISGELRQHIEKIADHVDELGRLRFEDPDITCDELADFCTTRASLLLFYCNGLNMVSIYVEDRANRHGEWYRAYMQSAMVWAEDTIRSKLGLPSLIPGADGGLVYSAFMNHVLNGEPDPFYAWCRDFPDYYLWRHGPKPSDSGDTLVNHETLPYSAS